MSDKERDMFYSNYGYAGMLPPNMFMPNQLAPNQSMMPNQMLQPNTSNMESRISKLEKQVNRLNARVARLESPYGNNTNNYTEPDSNMYMI